MNNHRSEKNDIQGRPPAASSKRSLHPTLAVSATLSVKRSLTAISTPCVGFDRIDFVASHRVYSPREATLSLPHAPAGYKAQAGRSPGKGSYSRALTYEHVDRGNAPRVVLLYAPQALPCPMFQVSLTAPELPHLILDLAAVNDVVEHFARACAERLIPSEVELTVDFPIGMFAELRGSIYVPGVHKCHEVKDEEDPELVTYYFGARQSAWSAKLYDKPEAGHRVARVELTLRRDALRALGIDTVYDLAHANWAEIFADSVRFVEFLELPGHENDWLQCGAAASLKTQHTVNGLLCKLKKPSQRRWFQRRLRTSPIAGVVQEAVRAFEAQLVPNHSEGCDCSLCTRPNRGDA